MSVKAAPDAAGNAASSASLARWDCGLSVGLPSVVRAPPRSAPIATTETSIVASQAPMALHGFRAQARASLWSRVSFVEDMARMGGDEGHPPPRGRTRIQRLVFCRATPRSALAWQLGRAAAPTTQRRSGSECLRRGGGGRFREEVREALPPARVAQRPAELALGFGVRCAARFGPHLGHRLPREQ